MTAFLVVGGLGLTLLVLSLVAGDLLGVDGLDLDGGSLVSGPVLGTFLASFGFAGALFGSSTGAGPALSAGAGLCGGVAMGYVAFRITEALAHMDTDEPVRTADLQGRQARVVTAIPDGGYGEVTVRHAGQVLKLNARADGPIPAGTTVHIVEVASSSSVWVASEQSLFGPLEP